LTGNAYIDEDTEYFLDTEYITENKLDIKTFYGRKHFEMRQPFIMGMENEFKLHFEILKIYEKDFMGFVDIITEKIKKIRNIDESLDKIRKNNGISVVDLFEIKRFVYFQNEIVKLLSDFESFKHTSLSSLGELWNVLDPKDSGRYFFSIDSDYSEHLRKEHSKIISKQKKLMDKHCNEIAFKYELPLDGRKEFLLKRNDIRVGKLMSSEYFTILKETAFSIHFKVNASKAYMELEKEKNDIEHEVKKEEIRYVLEIAEVIRHYLDAIEIQNKAIGKLDFDMACLKFKKEYNCCFPELSENNVLEFKNAVCVKIKDRCTREKNRYDDLSGKFGLGVSIIVGSNMGGKTSALKTIGQNVFLISMGIPCPAEYFATMLFSGINTVYRGKEEDGLSGFGMEVKRANKCFSKERSLNLIDEFGSGTNPTEGESLAVSLMNFLESEAVSCSIMVTHFPETMKYSDNVYFTGLFLDNEFKDFNSIYQNIDHSLQKKNADEGFPYAALDVAKMLGFPEKIVENARKNISFKSGV